MAGRLGIWMNGQYVGAWTCTPGGAHSFRYDPSWTAAAFGRPLSLSLPITVGKAEIRGQAVAHYFENLLPESLESKIDVSTRFGIKSVNAFDMLKVIGGDCLGAVQVLPEGVQPEGWNQIRAQDLDDADLEQSLDAPGQGTCLPGSQRKTALLRMAGRWYRPLGATPTTHILKASAGVPGGLHGAAFCSAENEWLCAQILAAMGFPVVSTELVKLGDRTVLVLERSDRRWQNTPPGAQNAPHFVPDQQTWIARLPMEDFCQAHGLAPQHKYEAQGGPSAQACLALLAGSEQAQADQLQFGLAQLAFWLLAIYQGHAKAFTLFGLRGGGFRLAPLTEFFSAWPLVGDGAGQLALHEVQLAMALQHQQHAYFRLREIRLRHWQALARSSQHPRAWEETLALASKVGQALDQVQAQLPPDFPLQIWDAVDAGVRRHAKQFLREVELTA